MTEIGEELLRKKIQNLRSSLSSQMSTLTHTVPHDELDRALIIVQIKELDRIIDDLDYILES